MVSKIFLLLSSKDTTDNTSRNPFGWVEEIEICNDGGGGSDEYGRSVMVMTVFLVTVEEGGGGGNGCWCGRDFHYDRAYSVVVVMAVLNMVVVKERMNDGGGDTDCGGGINGVAGM